MNRTRALLIAVLVLALAGLVGMRGQPMAATVSVEQLDQIGPTDLKLYDRMVDAVAGGEDYYHAAARLQRSEGYPLRPFYTVREPLLAWAGAAVGLPVLALVRWLLLLGCIIAWTIRSRGRPLDERALLLGLLSCTGASLLAVESAMQHEIWAGLLTALALALADRHWWSALALALLAALIRELAVPLLGAMALCAALDRDRRKTAGALLALGVFAGALALHAMMVSRQWLPTDPASQGWLGLRGPRALVGDLAPLSWLAYLPLPLAALAAWLPALGWARMGGLCGRLGALWFASIIFAVCVFARQDNDYWALLVLPGWLAGLALVPRALRQAIGKSGEGERGRPIAPHG